MSPKPEDQTNSLESYAASMLRHVHWWLAALIVLLSVAIYFEPVTLGYMCYSLALGVLWYALTLVTWRLRSSLLSVVTFFAIYLPHYLARTLHPPHRPSVTGILISGVAMFCILRLTRSRTRRFCRLSQ